MLVLGFDPSLTNFGWAVHDTAALGVARCPARGRFQTSSKTLFVDRYIEMRENVLGLLTQFPSIQCLGCESPVFKELYSEGMYGLFLYTCEAMRVAKRDVVLFSPPQVKVHARVFLNRPTFEGKAWVMGKPDMVEAAREDTGGKGVWNHNEADAYWVARSAARFWLHLEGSLEIGELTVPEQKQFTEIQTFKRGKRAGQTVERGILYREDERFFRWSVAAEEAPSNGEEEGTDGDTAG